MFDNDIIKTHVKQNDFKSVLDYSPNFSGENSAIIVETRKKDNLDWVADSVKYYTNWPIIFFCSTYNYNSISDVEKVIIPRNIDYSGILKDKRFWESIPFENILVFQHDSFMINHGIEDFLGYDYIGAPWYWAYGGYKDKRYKDLKVFKNGGNGGFSLRKNSKMIEIIENKKFDYQYEDMFFSSHLTKDIPLEKKKRFAVESIFYDKPLGLHNPVKYLSSKEISTILNS